MDLCPTLMAEDSGQWSQSRNRSNMATKVIADPLAGCPTKLLISKPDRIVTRDSIGQPRQATLKLLHIVRKNPGALLG